MNFIREIEEYFIHTCNIFLTASGITLSILGIITHIREYELYDTLSIDLCVGTWTLCLGLTILPLMVFGFYATYRQHKIFLLLFAILLILLFIAQISLGIFTSITLHPGGGIEKSVKTKFMENLKKNDSEFLNILDKFQKTKQCCGVLGPKDYKKPPASCKDKENMVHRKGCAKIYSHILDKSLRVIAYTSLVFSVPEIICAWLVLSLRQALLSRSSDLSEASN